MWNPFSNTKTPEVEAATPRNHGDWFVNTFGGRSTKAGQNISNSSSLAISTVYDCIRIISEDAAKLPLQIMQELPSGLKEKRKDNPLYRVLNWQANPEMSAMSFRNTIVSHVVGWGNGYAEKVRDSNGNVVQLWVLPPDRVKPVRDDVGGLVYQVTEQDGMITTVGKDKIFHVPGWGFDGIQGYNPIQIARESLGLSQAAEDYGSKFFGNGAKTSLAMTFPNKLSEPAYQNLQKSMENQIGGDNQHRILLVEEGGTVQTMSLNQKDSQYLETREFQITEICRWFRMQPHKVADLRRATFSNIEEQNIDYVVDTLQPWFTRFEQAIYNQLLTLEEQASGYFVKHNVNALLRGNTKDRFDSYASGIANGWITRNEVRELEDLNPIDGLSDPLVPLNMAEVGEEPVEVVDNSAFIEDVAGRIASAEERGLSARVDKANEDRTRFNQWAVSEYSDKQLSYASKALAPLFNNEEDSYLVACKVNGVLNKQIFNAKDPAKHIKTWNRKQEIIDIINEALTCTTK